MGVKNYLIEGLSGTGKTSVCTELQRRATMPSMGTAMLPTRRSGDW
jgi:adenylate kinase